MKRIYQILKQYVLVFLLTLLLSAYMPVSSSASYYQVYTAASGSFDDGSGANPYPEFFNGTYVIHPTGATQVKLSFTSFDTEEFYDFVYVYDGDNTSAPLIGQYDNLHLPPTEITSTGGSLCILFTSDGSSSYEGWTAQYTSVGGEQGGTSGGTSYTVNIPATTNYIHLVSPQVAMQTIPDITASRNTATIDEYVQYFDGLGRPLQTVSIKASPSENDVIQPVVYNNYDREMDKYLPFTRANNNGALMDNPIEATDGQKAFYNTLFPGEGDNARSHIVYEPSPLDRVLKQGSPGAAWQPTGSLTRASTEHVTSIDYLTNTANEVTMWQVTATGECQQNGNYASGMLYVTQTTDENNNQIKEYKDNEGHVVLKSVYDGSNWLKTYYVYDDFGQLHYVLPPKAVSALAGAQEISGEIETVTGSKTINAYQNKSYMLANGASLTLVPGFNFAASNGSTFIITQRALVNPANIMEQLAYQYTYDSHKRMASKKLPGAAPVYMVYDNRDRLVLTQDGKMRDEAPTKWLFTKYDAFNRPVLTGEYVHSSALGQADMQEVVNTFYANATADKYFESEGTSVHGYTNRSFPSVADENAYLTVAYYDNYNTVNIWGANYTYAAIFPSTLATKVNGLATGSKIKVLNTNAWLKVAIYYDDKYRTIQTHRSLFDGTTASPSANGMETTSTLYDFAGKAIQSKQCQTFNGVTTTVDKKMYYDPAGRLTKTEQSLDNWATVATLSETGYNELGQLAVKNIGNNAQQVDYKYNIRGWLTLINDPDAVGSDLFSMKLLYNDNNSIAGLVSQPQFNGNISGMVVDRANGSSPGSTTYGYGFTYDALNRLTVSDYGEGNGFAANADKYNEYGITYDNNGNIITLKRNNGSLIDNLSYAYRNGGNQLESVTDASGNVTGFKDVVGTDYDYDANGNLTKENNKGIGSINYNLLNLPYVLSKDGNNSIKYIYDASGAKLCKEATVGGTTTRRWYCGAMEYDNDKALSMLHTDEGIVEVTYSGGNPVYNYQYFLKDHLGNTRVVFNSSGSLLQRTDYYPFGMTANSYTNSTDNKYLYNGKELQQELALDWYSFGWRMYDPQICRFTCLDPLADKFHWVSPYNYAENRPIDGIDLWGLQYLRYDQVEAANFQPASTTVTGIDSDGSVASSTTPSSSTMVANADGTYNFTYLGTEYTNVSTITHDGQTYFNMGQHITDAGGTQHTQWVYTDIQLFDANTNQAFTWYAGANCAERANSQANELGTNLQGGGVTFGNAIQAYNAKTSTLLNNGQSIDYINSQLEAGNAVVVGVNYQSGSTDAIGTDHYVTITGRTSVNGAGRFTFVENAVGNATNATDFSSNRLIPAATGITGSSPHWYNTQYTVTRVQRNR